MFGWAVVEAIAWPIIPDFLLLPLVIAAPARAIFLIAAAVAGSVAGGAIAYSLSASGAGSGLLDAVPLVTARMTSTARATLTEEGAAGLLQQPLSGIPFKVYALQAEPAGLTFPAFVGFSALARGTRMLAVGLAGALVGRIAKPLIDRFALPLTTVYVLGFSSGLVQVVRAWS